MDVDFATVPGRYALALYELAEDKKALSSVEKDLSLIKDMVATSQDLAATIASPLYSADQVVAALADLLAAAKVSDVTANFVLLVAKNRRLIALPAMIRAFGKIVAHERGERVAEVTSATALSDAQKAELVKALEGRLGGKVNLETREDSTLIGGVVVKVGSRLVDASLKRKLERLRLAMKEVG